MIAVEASGDALRAGLRSFGSKLEGTKVGGLGIRIGFVLGFRI